MVDWLCKFGHVECTNHALKKFREWKETDLLLVDPLLKNSVFCNAIKMADIDDWEFVYEKAVNKSKTDDDVLLAALACTENESILMQ